MTLKQVYVCRGPNLEDKDPGNELLLREMEETVFKRIPFKVTALQKGTHKDSYHLCLYVDDKWANGLVEVINTYSPFCAKVAPV